MNSGVRPGAQPVQQMRDLLPVIDLLEIQQFDGRPGQHHAVGLFRRLQPPVERTEMRRVGVLAPVARRKRERERDVRAGKAELAGDLALGLLLFGHEVDQQHAPRRPVVGEERHALARKLSRRRQPLGKPDRHQPAFLSARRRSQSST